MDSVSADPWLWHEPRELVHDSQMGVTYGAMETLGAAIITVTPPIAGILFERDPLATGLMSISIVVSYVFLPRKARTATSQSKQDTAAASE